jgi:hypothetical protein
MFHTFFNPPCRRRGMSPARFLSHVRCDRDCPHHASSGENQPCEKCGKLFEADF